MQLNLIQNCMKTKFELELKLFWISESATKILIIILNYDRKNIFAQKN